MNEEIPDKNYKYIMVGYADNHTRDTYNLYNTDTKTFIMKRDVKWSEWKVIDAAETMKMFRNFH